MLFKIRGSLQNLIMVFACVSCRASDRVVRCKVGGADSGAKAGAEAVPRLGAQTRSRMWKRQHQTLRPVARLATEVPKNTQPGR